MSGRLFYFIRWWLFCLVDFGRGHSREHLSLGEDYSIIGSGGHLVC